MSIELKRNVAISILGPGKAFDDIAYPLYYSLKKLNFNVSICHNELNRDATNILIGLCDIPTLPAKALPKDTIIYNMEQLVRGSKGLNKDYLALCSRFQVWDYSLENIKRFSEYYGISNVTYVPLGYCPEMTRINPDYPKDIDVLFYGAINKRRKKIIEDLQQAGVNALAFSDLWGLDRDIMIARSKVILNIHYYYPGIQENIRLGYLWANKKCVVCEQNNNTSIHPGYEDSCMYAPYENITERTLSLLQTPKSIKSLEKIGFLKFSNNDFADILKKIIAIPQKKESLSHITTLPSELNIGSGKNFMQNALNIDINAQWNPDIILDISKNIDFKKIYNTRFGNISIKKGAFKKIYLFDVLEHLDNVVLAMTNMLELLSNGGELHIKVPYELSLGAWQDPTHKHAFNENSWLYYTEWHWYLGWREERFEIIDIQYTFSDLGKKLNRQNVSITKILQTPRAVDYINVILCKRNTSFHEKLNFDRYTRSIYSKTP